MLILPLTSDPESDFEVELEGRSYIFRFRFNVRDGCWYFDLSTAEGVSLRAGVRVVLETPLLRGVSTELPPGQLFASDSTGKQVPPGADDLGQRVQVYYLTAAELA